MHASVLTTSLCSEHHTNPLAARGCRLAGGGRLPRVSLAAGHPRSDQRPAEVAGVEAGEGHRGAEEIGVVASRTHATIGHIGSTRLSEGCTRADRALLQVVLLAA